MSGLTEPRSLLLADHAARFDGDALEHLASKGLVRRARKLLGVEPTVREDEVGLVIGGDGWSVSFGWDEPLPQGDCRCATAGVCQHVLAAIVHLGTLAGGVAPPIQVESPSPDSKPIASPGPTAAQSDETPVGTDAIMASLMSIGDDELLNWAKNSDFRWALQRLVAIDAEQIAVFTASHISVELPPPHANVRFMGPTLDEGIVKPSSRNDRRAVALGLLALWVSCGRQPPLAEESVARPTELVAERAALSSRAEKVSRDLVQIGLLHLGDGERERLDSLAASARGVKLYRLALLAERAADHIDALQDLSPEADTSRLLDQLAEIAVVAEAITTRLAEGKPLPDGLCGLARSRFENVGHLDLMGLGHYSWGDHRFAGSTGVFAGSGSQMFTVARPRMVNGRRLMSDLGWEGAGDLAALFARRVALSNAQVSEAMRLSGSGTATASLGSAIGEAQLEELAWTGQPPPSPSRLMGRTNANWVVLKVEAEAGPLSFDGLGQQSEWPLLASGQVVTLRLPYRPSSSIAVKNLERLAVDGPPRFVVGQLRSAGNELGLWPISVMFDEVLINLATAVTNETPRSAASRAGRGNDDPSQLPEQPPEAAIGHLEELSARLVRLADAGRRPDTAARLTVLSADANDWGFSALGRVISSAPDEVSAVLRAGWVAQLIDDMGTPS